MKTETMEHQKPVWRLTVGEGIAEAFKRLIRANYFYGLSAVLMLWGTYHLMYSPLVTGSQFARTLKALLVLQAYEVLVIATAILIVRRMKALDDAFMLLLVEIALLLDPTFFSNHFGALFYWQGRLTCPYGLWVNDACFLLAPFKLLVLLYGLRLRLDPKGWLAFVFAAFIVYLTEWPIPKEHVWLEWSRDGYCYLLAWAPLVFAAILPPVRDLIRVAGGLVVVGEEGKGFITAARRDFLNQAFLWLPLAAMFAHFVESSYVHDVFFYPMHLVPLVLAFGVLWVRNSTRDHLMARVLVLDALVSLAILLSLPAANVPRPFRPNEAAIVPDFMAWRVPLAMCGVLAVVLYGYFYHRFRYRPALYRAVVLCCLGAGAAFLQIEAVRSALCACWNGVCHAIAWAWLGFWKAVGKALRWIILHPAFYLTVLWAGLAALASRFRNLFTFFLVGAVSVLLIFGSLPGPLTDWTPEVLQSLFLLGIALDHGFSRSGKRQVRYCLALAMVLTALIRFVEEGPQCVWSGPVIALESALFIAGGILLRHPGYALVGALEGLAFVHAFALWRGWYGQPALVIFTAALGTFAAGVLVTFNKRRILAWLGEPATPMAAPRAVPDEKPPEEAMEKVESAEKEDTAGTE